MDVALFLMRDQGERRRFPLDLDVATIGRGEGCDLRIPLGDVSRKHCSLIKSDDSLVIQDIGSSNGTYVNGKRIQEARLRPGDLIRIGSLRFVVQIDGKPSEAELNDYSTSAEQTAPEAPAFESGASGSGSAKAVHDSSGSGAAQASGSHAPPRADPPLRKPRPPVKKAKIPEADLIDILDEDENFP